MNLETISTASRSGETGKEDISKLKGKNKNKRRSTEAEGRTSVLYLYL